MCAEWEDINITFNHSKMYTLNPNNLMDIGLFTANGLFTAHGSQSSALNNDYIFISYS